MRYTFTPPQPKSSAALEGHYCTGVYICVVFVEILAAVDPLGDEFGDFIIDLIDFLL